MSTAAQPAVRVHGACKTFGSGRRALHGVSFTVQPGERVALLGASGSGKSTLLRSLCALETLDQSAGPVEVFGNTVQAHGRVAADIRRQRRQVGIIFQQFNLVGRLPVLRNVLKGLAAELPLCRAGSSSAWPSHARCCRARGCCWPTSRWPRSTPNPRAA